MGEAIPKWEQGVCGKSLYFQFCCELKTALKKLYKKKSIKNKKDFF